MKSGKLYSEKEDFAVNQNPKMIAIAFDLERISQSPSLFDSKKPIASGATYIAVDPAECRLFEFLVKIITEPNRKHFDTERLGRTFGKMFEKVLEEEAR